MNIDAVIQKIHEDIAYSAPEILDWKLGMRVNSIIEARDSELEEYLDQLECPVPIGYGDDPKTTFEAGFGWAMDAIFDYLAGNPWKGGNPPPTHNADGSPK